MKRPFVHTQSVRLASGEEALVTRAVAEDGRVGFGYSRTLDATAARHMAEQFSREPLPEDIRAAAAGLAWLAS
ncbi:MAG TPA: hypothetical protein VG873_04025 [Burkholderiales bacterium]|nr:hypothetical protein [Burkholderiales bacterium]